MDIITVYFFYGLSFFSMGLAIMLEIGRASQLDFARALRPLAGFGLVHGSHEWVEMFLLLHPEFQESYLYQYVGVCRVVLLAISFLFLIAFGARLVGGTERREFSRRLLGAIVALWLMGMLWLFVSELWDSFVLAADVYTRYSLAIPGAALAAWGLILQRHKFIQAGMTGFSRDVVVAALAFGLYGGVGQVFAARSVVFPSQFLNSEAFMNWFGFPIQLFRSIMACAAAISIISSLRAFEEETRRKIEKLKMEQEAEQKQAEELRAELLRRTVRAQESERQRIALELHDELGQTLTALGLGLRAILDGVSPRQGRVKRQAGQLLELVDAGLSGLQNLISDLRPPQLDDFGLMAALRWYADEAKQRLNLTVTIEGRGNETNLSPDARIVLYRIVQESLVNVARHAKTDHASVLAVFNGREARVRVEDNGCGFDSEAALQRKDSPSWGLLGMIERAALIGGECSVVSVPGSGTLVEVFVPLKGKQA